MKKITTLILIFVMTLILCTGCGSKSNQASNDKITIVCTMFSQYDWAKQIIGDNPSVNIILLGDTGVDMHSFQPSADDIITISSCDVFIYGGGISDSWVSDILEEATNEDLIAINMMETLGDMLKEEEHVEGMEESEGHVHDESEHEHVEDYSHYDEHIWLSVKNAIVICEKITEIMCQVDQENAFSYQENGKNYIEKLNNLDEAYTQAVENANKDVVLFADRFPYIYMMKDYGIEYYAAFSGCSADTEASFETVAFLAEKTDEFNVSVILIEKGSSHELAKTIIDTTKTKNQTILEMYSIQAITMEQIEAGENYISIMEDNLLVLKQAIESE